MFFTTQKRRPRRMLALAVLIALAATIAAITASSAGAVTTTYASGAVGSWISGEGNLCFGAGSPSGRGINVQRSYVTGTPTYPNSYQTIWMIPRIDYSPDGTNWYVYGWGSWQSRSVYGANSVGFAPQFLSVPSAGYYRAGMVFYWYIGNVKVGEVRDTFQGATEYYAGFGADTASTYRSGTFCFIH